MSDFKTTPHQDRVFDLLSRDYRIPHDGPGNFYLRLDHLGELENITIDVILPHYDEQKFYVEIYTDDVMSEFYTYESWEECNKFLKGFEDKMYYFAELANKVKRKNAKGAKSRTTY